MLKEGVATAEVAIGVAGPLRVTEREIIEANASAQVRVQVLQRKDIGRAQGIVRGLLEELEAESVNLDAFKQEIEADTAADKMPKRRNLLMGLISVGARAQAARSLASALGTLVGLERQAWGIDAEASQTDVHAIEERVKARTERERKREEAARAKAREDALKAAGNVHPILPAPGERASEDGWEDKEAS